MRLDTSSYASTSTSTTLVSTPTSTSSSESTSTSASISNSNSSPDMFQSTIPDSFAPTMRQYVIMQAVMAFVMNSLSYHLIENPFFREFCSDVAASKGNINIPCV